jgi:hypothetical protein
MENNNNTTGKRDKCCSGHFHFYLCAVYIAVEFFLFLAAFVVLLIMSHERVILFTIDVLLSFIIINTSAFMAVSIFLII